jgi:hypothetical protein
VAVCAVQANPPQCSSCAFHAVPRLVPAPLQPPAAACPDVAAAQLGLHPKGHVWLSLLVYFVVFLALEAVIDPGSGDPRSLDWSGASRHLGRLVALRTTNPLGTV